MRILYSEYIFKKYSVKILEYFKVFTTNAAPPPVAPSFKTIMLTVKNVKLTGSKVSL